jgi:hypothetical protein
MDHVTAIFESRADAEAALDELDSVGVTAGQVSVIATDEARSRHFEIKNNTKADEGATTGAALGGLAGAVLAGMASAGAIAIPGLNVVVSGYLVSALAGFGVGAAGGGILGALVGLGYPEHEAKLYEDELGSGNILITVQPADSAQRKEVVRILDAARTGDSPRGKAKHPQATTIDRGGVIY